MRTPNRTRQSRAGRRGAVGPVRGSAGGAGAVERSAVAVAVAVVVSVGGVGVLMRSTMRPGVLVAQARFFVRYRVASLICLSGELRKPMLNLERLRTLDALARHGSVSGAAAGLHVTTSAVSQQMTKLEREVGQQLLAKNGRGVRLTDAGRLLAEHAARILSQVELAQADLEEQRGKAVGELRLSAFPTAMRGLLPATLTALRAEHPGLRVSCHEMEPSAMSNLLPWQGQLMVPPSTLVTGHCLWVQRLEKALNSPLVGWVTTTPSSLKILPPPTGMSDVLASTVPAAPPPSGGPPRSPRGRPRRRHRRTR
ncbi:HTH-type transcriptional regulator HdfR [Streptomyces alboniger]